MKKELKGFVVGVVLSSLIVSALPAMAEKITKSAELLYNDIKVVIDGKRADLKDANGNTVDPFIIDGTTYLPVRAVSNALNKAVSWDGATQTVYLEKNDEIEQPSVWLKDLETFTGDIISLTEDTVEFGGSEYNDYLKDNTGTIYNNLIKLGINYKSDGFSYNLNYKYSKFKGTLYLANTYKNVTTGYRMLIYSDDKLIYTSPFIYEGIKPVDFNVDVSNTAIMKVVFQHGNEEYANNGLCEPSTSDSSWFSNDVLTLMLGNAGLYE